MRQTRGVALIELAVSIGLFSIILLIFGVLYKIGNTNFRQGTTQVALSQAARAASEKVIPYLASAVPTGFSGGNFLYSPDRDASSDPSVANSIYNLDFSSCVDFLAPDPTKVTGYNDRRGGAVQHRYRIRFDTDNSRLLLEKIQPGSPAANPVVVGPPAYLAKNLYRVTFQRTESGINIRIRARAIDKNGKFIEDLQAVAGRSRSGDDDSVPIEQRALEYDLFTAVPLPYLNVH